MKLSSKEMTILSVFLSIVIIVAGVFLFILPEYEKIEPNQKSLQSAKDEKEQIYASLERENTIDQEIQDAIDQAGTLSLYFYEDMTTYEADVIIREMLEETNMSTDSLSVNSFTTAVLTVTDYVETMVDYPLKEYSGYDPGIIDGGSYVIEYDEEGKLIVPQDYIDKYGEEQALTEFLTDKLSTQSQTVGAITATFTVKGTRGDFLNFLNYIAALERSTIINSTTVAYTAAAASSSNNNSAPAEGEEGEAAPAPSTNSSGGEEQLTDRSEISASISMTMYCIMPMQPQESEEAEAEPEPAA